MEHQPALTIAAVRDAFVAEHRERVAAITIGELHQHQRNVRDALDVLEKHPCTAYREDIVAAIMETGYACDGGESIPTVDFYSLTDMAVFVAEVFQHLTKHDARGAKAIRRAMTVTRSRDLYRVSFGLPREENLDVA